MKATSQIAWDIRQNLELLAENVWTQHKSMANISEYSEEEKTAKAVQDCKYNLQYLTDAVSLDSEKLLLNYIDWLKILFKSLGFDNNDIKINFQAIREVLSSQLSKEHYEIINKYIALALNHIEKNVESRGLIIDADTGDTAREYLNLILSNDASKAIELINNAMEDGLSVKDVYIDVLEPVQKEIGRLWHIGEISVATEHRCTNITKSIMAGFYSEIFKSSKNGKKVLTTCIEGEQHDIGLRMVSDLLEIDGFNTFYIGSNTPKGSIVQTALENKIDILAVSATMTFHLKELEKLIMSIKKEPALADMKILVGGYPFNIDKNLWNNMGADGYARNAQESLMAAKNLVS